MEIAIGIVFLALFAGAFFLLVLITGIYFWRRSKRRGAEQSRQFASGAAYGAVGSSDFDNRADDDNYAYSEATNYSSSEENREASGAMSFESAPQGGGYASSDSGNSSSYDSSTSYDSGSSYDSSSSSDSGSSSSSSD